MATKISVKQLGDDILALIGKGGGASLEKEIISNTVCGAAPSGTRFPQGQTFTEFAEKILRKDITPIITTSFSNTGIKEIGITVNGTTMELNIKNLNDVTVPINEVRFYVNDALINSVAYNKNQSKYQYIYNQPITENTTVKAELIYSVNQKTSGTGSFSFYHASYYGTTTLSSISDSDISNLLLTFAKDVKNTKAFTWDNITLNDERFCYMYPASLSELSSIKDGNGFNQTDSYTKYTVKVTSPISGDVVQYYVYLLTDSATGIGFKQVYT